ncbi:MAG TPA: zinc ABC transporter substrate-binding protein, partial [Acidimicrobiia bacterium]|nr:zinc ABC transporter substrate-binding protein [Acidimicrobiia bacterium]
MHALLTTRRLFGRPARTAALAVACALAWAGAGASLSPAGATEHRSRGTVVRVVAAENFWGSIVSQLGGSHARVTSIITNPNTDPHSYEPTASDARTLADAQLVI